MSRWKSGIKTVFYYSGGTSLVRRRYQNALRICMYHRFPANSCLEEQCRHLKKHYVPISLTEAIERRETLPPNAVVVTVDDGYRDFLTEAFPVFSSYGIPVLVYLTTDLMDQNSWLWNDQVMYLFQTSHADQERKKAAFQLKEHMKTCSDADRLKILARLPEWLGVALPEMPPARYEPLHWQDIRLLSSQGVEFGAHTKSHPILSKLATNDAIQDEIEGSKQRIEQETGKPVRHFCYPNGKWIDFDSRSEEAVRSSGFQSAVTAEPGVNRKDTSVYRLLRLAASPEYSKVQFAQLIAGPI